MGFVVDLSIMWEPYKAAMTALKNTLDIQHVREIHAKQVDQTQSNLDQLETLLTEGVLTEEALLDNSHGFLNCLRECNASLRWAMMHRNSRNKKLRDIVVASLDPNRVLLLLLQSAQLEFRVGELYKQLLAHKEERWAKARSECALRVTELAHLFSGEQVLTRNIKDLQLQQWFVNVGAEVSSLEPADATMAGRKMQQLMTAMEDVEQFHQIEANAHVKHFLADARGLLRQV
jgi:WASH complex subunit strumpellin